MVQPESNQGLKTLLGFELEGRGDKAFLALVHNRLRNLCRGLGERLGAKVDHA